MRRRTVAFLAGFVALLVFGVGGAAAATTLVLDPAEAAPGTRVVIYNACLGVTDHPPARMAIAFVDVSRPGLSPTDASVPKGVARVRTAPLVYVFVVPAIPPGDYHVRLECLPGDWRTNLAEGGTWPLTVLPGSPSTSTAPVAGSAGDAGPPLRLVLIVGLGALTLIVLSRRGMARP